jgi:hypothetical protein
MWVRVVREGTACGGAEQGVYTRLGRSYACIARLDLD